MRIHSAIALAGKIKQHIPSINNSIIFSPFFLS